jgi:acetylglutamate kinase
VLLPLAESAAGQVLNVNADVVAREVAIAMKPLKTIMINSKGGWVNGAQDPDPGQKLARISMAEHYEEMASRDYEGRQGERRAHTTPTHLAVCRYPALGRPMALHPQSRSRHSYADRADRAVDCDVCVPRADMAGTLLKLKELKLILDALPPPASISLTSAEGLARELFSHRGLGTTVTH